MIFDVTFMVTEVTSLIIEVTAMIIELAAKILELTVMINVNANVIIVYYMFVRLIFSSQKCLVREIEVRGGRSELRKRASLSAQNDNSFTIFIIIPLFILFSFICSCYCYFYFVGTWFAVHDDCLSNR